MNSSRWLSKPVCGPEFVPGTAWCWIPVAEGGWISSGSRSPPGTVEPKTWLPPRWCVWSTTASVLHSCRTKVKDNNTQPDCTYCTYVCTIILVLIVSFCSNVKYLNVCWYIVCSVEELLLCVILCRIMTIKLNLYSIYSTGFYIHVFALGMPYFYFQRMLGYWEMSSIWQVSGTTACLFCLLVLYLCVHSFHYAVNLCMRMDGGQRRCSGDIRTMLTRHCDPL